MILHDFLNIDEQQYAVLSTMLIVLEAALMGDILLNKHWEEVTF